MKLDYNATIKKMCVAANNKASWSDYCTEDMMKAALAAFQKEMADILDSGDCCQMFENYCEIKTLGEI